MAFLSSNKIKVFPTAFRGQDASGHAIDPGSFLTTEENFVNIANKITYLHKDYFYVDGNITHIILGGYYFVASVSDIQALFSSPANGDEIWACINVADFGSAYESTSVKTLTPNGGSAGETLDDSTNFKGLTFLGKNDSKDGFTYKLNLFKRVSNAWVVEENSQVNIATNQISNGGDSSTPINKLFTTSSVDTNNLSASYVYINSTYTQFISGYSADTIVLNAGLLPTTCGPYTPQIDLGGYVYSADYYAHFRNAYISNVCFNHYKSDTYEASIGVRLNPSMNFSGYTVVEAYYYDTDSENYGLLSFNGFNRINLSTAMLYASNGIYTNDIHTDTMAGFKLYGNIIPSNTNINLGNSTTKFKSIYADTIYPNNISGEDLFITASESIILCGDSSHATDIYIGTDWDADVATPYLTNYTAIGGAVTEIAGSGALIQLGSSQIVFKGDPKGLITHGAKSITDADFVKSGSGNTWNNAFADTGARKHVTWSRIGESVRISLKLNNPNQNMSRWLWHRISLDNLAKIVGSSKDYMTSPGDYLTCVGNVISNSSASDGSISWRVEGNYLYFIVGDGDGYPTGVSLDISFNLNDY